MTRLNPESNRHFAKRSLGQNFLTDYNYIQKIVNAVCPVATDCIIEIGPGRGALTKLLIGSGAEIVAFELDHELIPLLSERFGSNEKFRLVEQNALDVDFLGLAREKQTRFKLVANLPYYISTAILQHLIEQRDAFSEMVLMFQKEVVQRMVARPGTPERGFLTVLVEAFLCAQPLFDVPPAAFRPSPKVWSTVIRLQPATEHAETDRRFKSLVSAAFRHPRKTILNNLKAGYPHIQDRLQECAVDLRLRPEALTHEQWMCIVSRLPDPIAEKKCDPSQSPPLAE